MNMSEMPQTAETVSPEPQTRIPQQFTSEVQALTRARNAAIHAVHMLVRHGTDSREFYESSLDADDAQNALYHLRHDTRT